MEKENKYMIGEYENTIFIKFVGNCTMKTSKALSEVFDDIFSKEKKEIVLALEDCNYMDSTTLGLIAKVAIRIKKSWQDSIYAINVPPTISAGFKSTGIDRFISILQDRSVDGVEMKTKANTDFTDKEAKSRHILESHKILSELNEENRKAFKNVVELLEKDLGENKN